MKNFVFSQKIYSFLLAAYRWYLQTPERSLHQAYDAALKIKEIEDKHFNGNKIDTGSAMYSNSVMDYFESDLNKLLKTARMRLTEFRASRWFLNEENQKAADKAGIEFLSPAFVLERLNFIDGVISKYTTVTEEMTSKVVAVKSPTPQIDSPITPVLPPKIATKDMENKSDKKPKGKTDTMGVLPRSILSTISRLQVELDPNSEEEVIQSFRQAQRRTIISIRFILLLIIVPLLTHQIAKAFVVGPAVDRFRTTEEAQVFLNSEMEEEALGELQRFEERIKFENLVSNAPPLSVENIELELKDKATEIAEEFRRESSNSIKNVFADMFSVVAFIWLMVTSKSSIAVLKDFFDHIVYGLSDSAKAFIIILFTDIFVGFHSPHGWEVLLEGVSRHWGLPANRDFIFLFIATFPVILDTIFKYWIFRYLNRISPSAVATYRNMNE
ncbi:proton extrusion protein PcxA [Nostoc linckia z18]|uniref:Proton extrusion protein PxcA n=2 Tax=Nostoc linckia TaxID=92942 RepID=A0A9Q6EJB3_NOSLI|nr:proton extrusion protein PcxA [Nostoc linckia z3]PHJ68712.1 proton extrusion protein PcxA [Nostoc linckia z1]PHJ74022.1 proton extrusion protein PcxA [Nostoc linckia z2]PHJ83892.1 proton extrusion protein PcxA [Nostoc linckia z4]PHJ91489.1 proton extrusion protein PcxA [Nostoc linckia z6]PHJ95361.1 proton extrusion protein PcxA [Nostoc linckia z7]PHJ99436.1 proton extrusion protein PcxA [Nostoc linckia z8]PHK07740.1 proton extrusion protein PcxA [Nostoc linckia z9]PHK17457.1 proton extru